MSRRSRGKQDARAKASAPPSSRQCQGPTIVRTAEPLARPAVTDRAARVRQPWEDTCPVCGAEAVEEGQLGCCGAIVVSCAGSVDGKSHDWDDDRDDLTDEQESEIIDKIEYHYWFEDTGMPAPAETGPDTVPCRCEGRPHAQV